MNRSLKLIYCCVLTSVAFSLLADDVPVVSNVRLGQNGGNVVVLYDLSTAPAVVTMEVLTNGVPLAEASQASFSGAVNRYVPVGEDNTISFSPRDILPANLQFPGTTVRVKAWNVEAPPDYMTIQLVEPYAVRYYVSPDALPFGGLSNDLYRTSVLVMRRIHAAGVRWGMGNLPSEVELSDGTYHMVTLSSDYYIGVFEVTQLQQELVYGSRGSYELNYADSDVLPVHARRRDLRPYSKWWKLDNHEFSGTWIISSFRAKTGVKFDLPTEAQWEYACRAGSNYPLNLGELTSFPANGNYDRDNTAAILNRCAWHTANSDDRSHRVGSLEPNDWGIYDMHGNLAEWPLDYMDGEFDLAEEIDPAGKSVAYCLNGDADNPCFAARGGYYGYRYYFNYIKNASRWRLGSWESAYVGYRLCAPARATATEF